MRQSNARTSMRDEQATREVTAAANAIAGVPARPLGESKRSRRRIGSVVLVGCGPGALDLLTLRAARVIAQADVLVYDRLVDPAIVALGPVRAQRICVGKARSHHLLPQQDINALLVRLAREGKRVARLKGGDPFIFGRGGEEVEALAREGIPFEVVPGITAACGVAAHAGIPLTHRDCAHAVTLVTGHLADGDGELDWTALARPRQTVVFYMGLMGLPAICARLVAHGAPASTPAAIVQHATLPTQRVVTGTLADLAARADAACLVPPTLIVVGEVVRLQSVCNWFASHARSVATAA
ncbi:MAG: uroporphyrinogen-III C-methyltransferase [Burkholderiales bacterium]|nr:uroporphyrinogen-III C-methyltransferase [Burkholderiales bacterium]